MPRDHAAEIEPSFPESPREAEVLEAASVVSEAEAELPATESRDTEALTGEAPSTETPAPRTRPRNGRGPNHRAVRRRGPE